MHFLKNIDNISKIFVLIERCSLDQLHNRIRKVWMDYSWFTGLARAHPNQKTLAITSVDNITNVYFFICWQNKKIIAVTCSTDYSSEYNLISTVHANVRRYVCICDGKSTLFNGGRSCYLHYWICPLTT